MRLRFPLVLAAAALTAAPLQAQARDTVVVLPTNRPRAVTVRAIVAGPGAQAVASDRMERHGDTLVFAAPAIIQLAPGVLRLTLRSPDVGTHLRIRHHPAREAGQSAYRCVLDSPEVTLIRKAASAPLTYELGRDGTSDCTQLPSRPE